MIFIYLITLFIAPQLWIEPFIGLRVDLIVYPLWILVLFFQGKLNRVFEFKSHDYFILAFLVWMYLSIFTNPFGELSGKMMFEYIKWFVLYRLVYATLDEFEILSKAINRMLLLIFIIVIEGIQHKLSSDGIGWAGQTLGWVDPSVLRAGGTGRTQWINIFDGPGVFCVMYVIALPFVLMNFDKQYSKFRKFLSIGLLGALLLAIYYTGSRGGFLATIGIIGLYIVLRFSTRLNISISKLSAIGCIFLIALMLAPSHMTQIRDENKSAQHRVDMWAKGVHMVEQNPLFGIGRGNFADYSGSLIAHNSAIEVMGEMGLPGLFFWIGFYYLFFRQIYLFYKNTENDNEKSLAKAMGLCLVGYIANSMFVTLEYETQYLLFGLSSALVANKNSAYQATGKDFVLIGLTTLVWVVIVKSFVMIYY